MFFVILMEKIQMSKILLLLYKHRFIVMTYNSYLIESEKEALHEYNFE